MTFSAQVDKWVRESQKRVEVVFKESAQDVIAEMQAVGPSVANPDSFGTGNMPVDTGFLRASLQARLNEPPGVIRPRPAGDASYSYSSSPIALVIAGAAIGDTIYATYGANYASIMEQRYAFRRLAAQNWQQIVDRQAKRMKARG